MPPSAVWSCCLEVRRDSPCRGLRVWDGTAWLPARSGTVGTLHQYCPNRHKSSKCFARTAGHVQWVDVNCGAGRSPGRSIQNKTLHADKHDSVSDRSGFGGTIFSRKRCFHGFRWPSGTGSCRCFDLVGAAYQRRHISACAELRASLRHDNMPGVCRGSGHARCWLVERSRRRHRQQQERLALWAYLPPRNRRMRPSKACNLP